MEDQELDQILDSWRAPAASPGLRRQLSAAFPAPERGRILGVPVRWMIGGIVTTGLVALAAAALGIGAGGGLAMGSADTPSGPIYAKATSIVEPPIASWRWTFRPSGISFGETKTGIRGSSWIAEDRRAGPFYGLEYTADRMADGRYRVTVASLSQERLQRDSVVRSGPIVPLPSNPGPMVVTEGQPFDVPVYMKDGTRITVRLWLASTPFSPSGAIPPAPMQLNSAKLLRNGIELKAWAGVASGATLWFRLPGQGRYVIALDPRGNTSFTKAGQVNGNALEFQANGDAYRLESSKAIASGSSRPVYVWHDAGFENGLKAGSQDVMFGSAGPACIFNSSCNPGR